MWVEKGLDVGVALDLVAGAFRDEWIRAWWCLAMVIWLGPVPCFVGWGSAWRWCAVHAELSIAVVKPTRSRC